MFETWVIKCAIIFANVNVRVIKWLAGKMAAAGRAGFSI